MEIDERLLAKLKAMDDESLRAAIAQISDSLGADEKQKRRALSNAGFIKRKIASANVRELKALIAKLGGNVNIDELVRGLNL